MALSLSVACLLWLVFTFVIIVWQVLLRLHFPEIVHKYLHTLFYFGKLRDSKIAIKSFTTDVPKRWFLHFYVIGVVCNTSILMVFINVVIYDKNLPTFIEQLLNIFSYPLISAPNNIASCVPVFVILIMEELKDVRRLYECLYVHSFSSSKMSIMHYIMGVVYYSVFGLSVLSEVNVYHLNFTVSITDGLMIVLSVCLYSWSCCQQHQTFIILANLRAKDRKDSTTDHYVPNGGLFQYVSCPHFLAEILIYFSMNLAVCFQHQTLLCLFIFVFVNQMSVSLITHAWYKRTFPSYPKDRTAFIPFIL